MMYLVLGLLIGYWTKDVYVMLKTLYDERMEAREANKAGVVRPSVTKLTKSVPIDLSSDAGAIRRPTPNEIALQSLVEQDKTISKALR